MRKSIFALFMLFVVATACDEKQVSPDNSLVIADRKYVTVTIGNQVWTAENYAGPGGVSRNASAKDPIYGKYYSKAELASISLPEGWRVPTAEDYKTLAAYHGISIPSTLGVTNDIKKLTSTENWKHVNGTNSSGFNAHPAGYIFGDGEAIDGDIAEFWTTEGYSFSIQEAGANLASLRVAMYDSNNSPDFRFNVRFVKDLR